MPKTFEELDEDHPWEGGDRARQQWWITRYKGENWGKLRVTERGLMWMTGWGSWESPAPPQISALEKYLCTPVQSTQRATSLTSPANTKCLKWGRWGRTFIYWDRKVKFDRNPYSTTAPATVGEEKGGGGWGGWWRENSTCNFTLVQNKALSHPLKYSISSNQNLKRLFSRLKS